MRIGAGQGAGTGWGGGALAGLGPWASALWLNPRAALAAAFEIEVAERRLFLWLPAACGLGVVLYFNAAQEPSFWPAALGTSLFAFLARATRNRQRTFLLCAALCGLFCGHLLAHWRSLRVAAPVLDRVRIVELTGFVEEMNLRRQGARFLLRIASAEGLSPSQTPYRVRLTLRQNPNAAAGDFVALKARLLPPSRASLPGGYDFARDAYFARIGAVGSVLGRIEVLEPPDPPDWSLAFMAGIDRARNTLATRITEVMSGDSSAIAVAMVTGKRDLLAEGTRELIREAGIFHIITISGIQMTLVAGIFFWCLRSLLALSSTLALHYPIKKWAAGAAMAGAIFYDISTGSRVGTERALFMTLIVFAAVICDRQALTMRNLALAALLVMVLEPEAILGVSFQLSFAAVAALVSVYEARMRSLQAERSMVPARPPLVKASGPGETLTNWLGEKLRHGPGATLFATLCATSATASFMAYHFHELSPYVLIGNPLTLVVIEIFAVPGALLGAALYPLGLDAPVWHYVGLGIDFVLWAARQIAAAPGATVHLVQFAPWAIVFLSLAVLSAVLWRTAIWRATAIPLLVLGILGAISGEKYDVAIAPGGEALALRQADGSIALLGKRPNAFAGEQWLRAAGDGRRPADAVTKERCDALGCTALLADGRVVALVLDPSAFAEDCGRASVVVTPLFAPGGCTATLVIDRRWLTQAGATTLAVHGDSFYIATARAPGEDRPWSLAPKTRRPAKISRGRFLRASPERPGEADFPRDENGPAPWL